MSEREKKKRGREREREKREERKEEERKRERERRKKARRGSRWEGEFSLVIEGERAVWGLGYSIPQFEKGWMARDRGAGEVR